MDILNINKYVQVLKTISSIKICKNIEPRLGELGAMKVAHNSMKIIGKIIPIKIFRGIEYLVKPIVMTRVTVSISIKNLIKAFIVNRFI